MRFGASVSSAQPFGTVSPSTLVLAPGASGVVHVSARVPAGAGDSSGSVVFATAVGPVPSSQKIALVLPLAADYAGLRRWASAVTTPGSPDYAQYESIAELARRFGISLAGRRRVLDYLRGAGARAHLRGRQ